MAKKSITSLTEDKCRLHVKNAAYRAELACDTIPGFHLQKLKTSAAYRFRYRDMGSNARIVNLGAYIEGKADRIEAAKQASILRGIVTDGGDPAADAKRMQAKQKAEYDLQQTATVGQYLEGIYKRHQARQKDEGIHNLNFIRKNFAEWFSLPMANLTPAHLKQWQLSMETAKREVIESGVKVEKIGYSHAYITRVFGAFRTMIRHAVAEGVLSDDPIAKFRLQRPVALEKAKKLDGSDKQKRRELTPDEIHQLMAGAELFRQECLDKLSKSNWKRDVPMWFYPFFYLAYYTGLRPGDLYTLNWNELNLNFKRLTTTPNKTQHHSDPIEVSHKLNDYLTDILKEWHKLQGSPTSGLVFPPDESRLKKKRKPDEVATMYKKSHVKNWQRILKLGKVESRIDFYSLRHHFCSKLVASGKLSLLAVAHLAGHKSAKMIEQHYGHLSPNAATDAMDIMSADVPALKSSQTGRSNAI